MESKEVPALVLLRKVGDRQSNEGILVPYNSSTSSSKFSSSLSFYSLEIQIHKNSYIKRTVGKTYQAQGALTIALINSLHYLKLTIARAS